MRQNGPDRRALGAIIREFRDRRGLSQEALADRCALHRTYIGGVERGERNPSFESVARILTALGRSWSELGRALDGWSR